MLREQLNDALKDAMKARDQRKTATIRLILAAIKDRDIAARSAGSEEVVDDDGIREIMAKMVRQRGESIAAYEEAGRTELADQEREEIEILKSFLPRQMSDEEIEAVCREAIEEVGAERLKDIGRVMGLLKSRYAGQMDFGKASACVKSLLS